MCNLALHLRHIIDGLRDYGTAKWEGGDPGCDHIEPSGTTLGKKSDTFHGSNTQEAHEIQYKRVCAKCGAIRIDDQIGLEQTPDDYVSKLVQVFREVKRVLKDDGTLWLNLGDSYAGSGCGTNDYRTEASRSINKSDVMFSKKPPQQKIIGDNGMKPKDLIGIPWLVAFALRADGWYLRSDIIWHKPNPMPESVKDRPTKAHEYLFLLSKSKQYYYDSDAIREPYVEPEKNATLSKICGMRTGGHSSLGKSREVFYQSGGRNKRSVWTINTKGFSGAHFAVMPEKLVEPCILAGTSEKGQCPKCGANWVRVTDRVVGYSKECPKTQQSHEARGGNGKPSGTVGKSGGGRVDGYSITAGWQPTCNCGLDPVPNTVLDPFVGSGTVGAVSVKHGRDFIGIDLNDDYLKIAEKRIKDAQQQMRLPLEAE